MTIAQYLRLLREQWIAVVALTVLGTLGAGAWSLLQTPQYQASAQLFVSVSSTTGSLGDLTQGSTFTQARVKSYTDLLTSPQVLSPVIQQLSLDTSPIDLGRRVTATSPLDTVLIDVTVTDASPARAADIANSISTHFPTFVNSLETPDRQTTSPVKVSVTRAAVAPAAPVSPRKTLDLALGLLVGLGLGVGVGVLRDSLDRSVGSRTQVAQISGAPVLGAVGEDPDVPSSPLITHDAFSPRAESFRQLRTNIRYLSVDHRVGSLVVTGSVQSEGKTTTAANVAIALAQSGERVVLIDADLRRPTVGDVFGLPGGVGLTSVLVGDVAVAGALQRWRDDLPLEVMAAGPLPPNPSELIGSERMVEIIHELTDSGATVVIDSPPLLPVTDAAILARITDGALVVARAGSTKVEQFSAAVESLRTAGATILGIVLNRVPKRASAYGGGGYGTYGGYAPTGSPSGPARLSAAPADPARTSRPSRGRGRGRTPSTARATATAPATQATALPAAPTAPAPVTTGPGAAETRAIDVTAHDAARPPAFQDAAGSPYPAEPAGPSYDVVDYEATGYEAPDAPERVRPAAGLLGPGGHPDSPAFGQLVSGRVDPSPRTAPSASPSAPAPDLHVDLRDGAPGRPYPGAGSPVVGAGSAVIGGAQAGPAYAARSAYAQHLAADGTLNGYADVHSGPAVNGAGHGMNGMNGILNGVNGGVVNGGVNGGVNGAVNGSDGDGQGRRGRRSAPPRQD